MPPANVHDPGLRAAVKRLLDLCCTVPGVLLLAPVFVLIAAILRLTGEGEVFFAQTRIGRHGRPFRMFKFATMLKDSPNLPGGVLTRANDPRILPVGRFLRKTKLNELPQLINVVMGHMSLVGPRPQAAAHFVIYPDEVRIEIQKVRPGVTGIAQIVLRHEETVLEKVGTSTAEFYDRTIMPYKGALEVWYVQNASVALDLKLLALTVLVLLRPESRAAFRLFEDLPDMPAELAAAY